MQLFLYWLLILYSLPSINTSVYNISLCFFYFYCTTYCYLGYINLIKPYFSVVQTKNPPLFLKIKTLLFGCANPTFRLCKPYFSVVQTLLFGCANPTFRLCNENRIAQPRAFSRLKNRPYIYLYILLLREEK